MQQPLETLLAPELQQARRRRRNWLTALIVVLVAAGVVALEFRRVYEWVQGVRSRRMAAKAEAEMLGGNVEEAIGKARTAYQTKPDEPAAIRTSARVQRFTGQSAAAVPLWRQLSKAGMMQQEDRLFFAEDLLRAGAIAEAGTEIESLLNTDTPGVPLLRLAARWAALEGDNRNAREFAGRAVRMEPDSDESQLLLGVLQTSSDSDAIRRDGIQTLLELGRRQSKEALDALVQIGTMKGTPVDAADLAMELLRQHPLANEQHRILAFGIQFALHPEDRTALLDSAVEKYRQAEPPARCAFGMWLHRHQEYERMLALIPVEEAFKRQDLLRVCLEALTGLRRYNEIERILGMKGVPLDVAFKELYLARCAEELGSKSVAELHWRRAHLAAAPSPKQMREIAAYAEKFGRLDQAEIALRSLSSNSSTARYAMEGLLRIAQQRGDLPLICDTLKKMNQRWPQDDSVANDLAYFNLLQGKAVDESFAAAKNLVARSPKSLAHRTTLALAAIRKRDAATALSAYEGIQVPWDRVSPSYRTVYAAALGMGGKSAEARAEVAALSVERLRPEERELIRQWRTQ